MGDPFRVGVTRDFLRPDGSLGFGDIGLGLLDEAAGIQWEFLADDVRELRADQVAAYDGLLVQAPKVTAASLERADRLAIVARFGVGYDSVDVEACTRHGVALTITPDAVRRPVAAMAMTLLLAATHNLVIKDRLARENRWAEKLNYMGMGVTGRTLGVVGLGNIGREILRLARPFDMRHLAYDPHVQASDVRELNVELVELDVLLRASDYVMIACALTHQTHHLIDAQRLSHMKPTAFLFNVARGPIVDQAALTRALCEGRIRGAGLDVFETEPPDPDDPILQLDNVILAPHALCWTDECFYAIGQTACRSILDVAAGRLPKHVVNRDVLTSDAFLAKLGAHPQVTK
jgi:D-3-phosphoglycerate dehydrogenase